jgi:hypothetical protein
MEGGWAIDARQIASRSQPVSKDGFKRDGRCVSSHAAECGVPWGRKRAFEKPQRQSEPNTRSAERRSVTSIRPLHERR